MPGDKEHARAGPPDKQGTLNRRRFLIGTGAAAVTVVAGAGIVMFDFPEDSGEADPTPDVIPQTTPTQPPLTETPPSPEPTEDASPEISPEPTPTLSATVEPPTERVLQIGLMNAIPESHDFNADIECGGILGLWAGLVQLDAQLSVMPAWASHWQSYDEWRRWHFFIRPENQGWSNGDPVTAHDFAWSWRRKLRPEAGAKDAQLFFDILNAREIHAGEIELDELGVSALDDWTLEVRLNDSRTEFVRTVASASFLPAKRTAGLEDEGEQYETEDQVTNGPYRLTRNEQDLIELQPNPGFWSLPELGPERVVIPRTDAENARTLYDENALDIIAVHDNDLLAARVEDRYTADLARVSVAATWVLLPPLDIEPFNEIPVRRALAHAIDRRRLVQILEGRVADAISLMPPGIPLISTDSDMRSEQRFSVDRSLEELSGTAWEEPDLWPLLEIEYDEADPLTFSLCRDIADQLMENLGVVSELRSSDRGVSEAVDRWRMLRIDYYTTDLHQGYSHIAELITGWSNLVFESLIFRAAQEADPDLRSEFYREAEIVMQRDAVYLPIAHPVQHLLIKPWVQEFQPMSGSIGIGPDGLPPGWLQRVEILGRP